MKRHLLVALVGALILLAGCNEVIETTQYHIRDATDKCAANGGVRSITRAEHTSELESCGYKCGRATGYRIYTGRATCSNGAGFDLEFKVRQ